jgi:hypothetical protein
VGWDGCDMLYVDRGRFWDVSGAGWGRSNLVVLVHKRGEAIGGNCGW